MPAASHGSPSPAAGRCRSFCIHPVGRRRTRSSSPSCCATSRECASKARRRDRRRCHADSNRTERWQDMRFGSPGSSRNRRLSKRSMKRLSEGRCLLGRAAADKFRRLPRWGNDGKDANHGRRWHGEKPGLRTFAFPLCSCIISSWNNRPTTLRSLMHIEHIALWTDDIDRLTGFYAAYFRRPDRPTLHQRRQGHESCFLSLIAGHASR